MFAYPRRENHRPPIRKTFQFSCWPMFKLNCIGGAVGILKPIARNELWDGLLFLFSLLSIIVTRNDCARNELLSLLYVPRIKSWSWGGGVYIRCVISSVFSNLGEICLRRFGRGLCNFFIGYMSFFLYTITWWILFQILKEIFSKYFCVSLVFIWFFNCIVNIGMLSQMCGKKSMEG